jgi:hypothetical protein
MRDARGMSFPDPELVAAVDEAMFDALADLGPMLRAGRRLTAARAGTDRRGDHRADPAQHARRPRDAILTANQPKDLVGDYRKSAAPRGERGLLGYGIVRRHGAESGNVRGSGTPAPRRRRDLWIRSTWTGGSGQRRRVPKNSSRVTGCRPRSWMMPLIWSNSPRMVGWLAWPSTILPGVRYRRAWSSRNRGVTVVASP